MSTTYFTPLGRRRLCRATVFSAMLALALTACGGEAERNSESAEADGDTAESAEPAAAQIDDELAPHDEWAPLGTGEHNAITDVPGIKVGQYNQTEGDDQTGVTVITAEGVDERTGEVTRPGAVGGAEVLGGWPATREVSILDPTGSAPRANAVLLTGGSTFGLDAAGGVMKYLDETLDVLPPVVPGAVIYDLGLTDARPDAEFGYSAAESATDGPVEQGNVGAGTGATTGGLKGGVGTASAELEDGIYVGAIAVTNSHGLVTDPRHCGFISEFLEIDDEFAEAGYQRPTPEDCNGADAPDASSDASGENTTIGVVATNAPLTAAQAHKMAAVAHTGLARGVRPVHTVTDGDSIFALATGDSGEEAGEEASDYNKIYSAAADAFSRAINHSMIHAESVDDWTSYCDMYPSACDGEE